MKSDRRVPVAIVGGGFSGTMLAAQLARPKGRYWEIVAVPDIREQAAAVAEDIAEELKA